MPGLKYEMTWRKNGARWAKEYKGKQYAVSCKQLNAPPTKEGSREAANEWWRKKQAEIDAENAHHLQEQLDELDKRILAAKDKEERRELKILRIETERTRPGEDPPIEGLKDAYREFSKFVEETGAQVNLENLSPDTLMAVFGKKKAPPAPTKLTLEHWSKEFLDLMRVSGIKPGTYQQIEINLGSFLNCPGLTTPQMHVNVVTEDLWKNYFLALAKRREDGEIKADAMKAKLLQARRFIDFLWTQKLIELPRNLHAKTLKVKIKNKKVKVPGLDKVHGLLKALTDERLRLYVLLMLNCGMYQVDIANLLDEEVDWTKGTITRKRTKTEDNEDTPEVCYKLWDETFTLLQKHRSGEERVLLSEEGTVLVEYFFDKDKKDLVQLRWKRWNKRRFAIQLKQFRKVGSSLLETHETYGRYILHYLGHSPRGVAAKHYVTPSQDLFDKAIDWLGLQILVKNFVKNGSENG